MDERLPDVADAIYGHDTTGMAEPFPAIEDRLRNFFADADRKYEGQKDINVLIVPHAFAIKTIFHIFAPEQLSKIGKVKNAAVSGLMFDGGSFLMEPNIL